MLVISKGTVLSCFRTKTSGCLRVAGARTPRSRSSSHSFSSPHSLVCGLIRSLANLGQILNFRDFWLVVPLMLVVVGLQISCTTFQISMKLGVWPSSDHWPRLCPTNQMGRVTLEGLPVSPKPAASRKINKRIISHLINVSDQTHNICFPLSSSRPIGPFAYCPPFLSPRHILYSLRTYSVSQSSLHK